MYNLVEETERTTNVISKKTADIPIQGNVIYIAHYEVITLCIGTAPILDITLTASKRQEVKEYFRRNIETAIVPSE